MTRVGILGVRVRENLLISSSTLPGLGRVSGTTTANSRTFTPPFPSLLIDVVTFPSSPGAAFGTVAAAVCPWTRCSRARWLWRGKGPDRVGRRGGWNGPARCPRNLRRPRPSGRYRQCTIARGRYHKSSWRHPLDLATTKKTMLTLAAAAAAVDSSLVSSRRSRSRYLLHRPRSRLRSEE